MQPNEPEASAPDLNNQSDKQAEPATPNGESVSPILDTAGGNPAPQIIEPTTVVQPSQVTPAPNAPQVSAEPVPDVSAESISPENTVPATTTQPVVSGAGFVSEPPVQPTGSSPAPHRRNKKLLMAGAVLSAVVLLGGASAAAYFGYVVPNRPENVLKSALVNSLEQKKFSFDGNLEVASADSSKDSSTPATKLTFKGFADADKQVVDANVSVTVMGISVPGELRYVDKTAYVKLGDLSTVKGLVSAFDPSYASLLDKVSNQWIEIDSTLIKQAKLDCVLDSNVGLTQADLKALSDGYQKNPFLTINSTSNDSVNGKAATKFDLTLDDNKNADYLKANIDNISFIKKYRDCSGNKTPLDTSSLADGDHTPLTLWVDKATHRIIKLETKSTEQDAKKDDIKGSLSVTIGYDAQSVEKPANAKPIMSLLSELAPLTGDATGGFSFDGATTTSSFNSSAADSERQADIKALRVQLEAYYAQQGYYPDLHDMNNGAWLKTNMNTLDKEALKDPEGSGYTLAAKPAARIYAYQPTTDTGAACSDAKQDCQKYTLTATLSDGKTYTEVNLE